MLLATKEPVAEDPVRVSLGIKNPKINPTEAFCVQVESPPTLNNKLPERAFIPQGN
jgi:hypothetical protein